MAVSEVVKKRTIRPRDAATLIVYRRDPDGIRLLMARRKSTHVFMPGALVFPGGRVERGDRFAPSASELSRADEERLVSSASIDTGRARALALCAIRETYEETGYLIGCACEADQAGTRLSESWKDLLSHGVKPSLSEVRFISRAVTPTTQPRRFDTRFFIVNADMICKHVKVPDEELDAPQWVTFAEALASKSLQWITGQVLKELEQGLGAEGLDDDLPVTYRRKQGGSFKLNYL